MNIDFSKLSAAISQKNIIEPREIFYLLQIKHKNIMGI